MQICRALCLGEGKDVVRGAEVESENACRSFVCQPPQRGDVSGACMQSHCLALASQLVHECQNWKGPVLRGHLSQILAPKVIPPSPGGAGALAEPGPALRTLASWYPHLPLHCTTSCGFPAVLVCVMCGVSAGLCWGGGGRKGGSLCSTDCLSSELMDPLHRQDTLKVALSKVFLCEFSPSSSRVYGPSSCPYLGVSKNPSHSWSELLGSTPRRSPDGEGPALRKGSLLHTSLRNADTFSKALRLPASFQHLPWCGGGQG